MGLIQNFKDGLKGERSDEPTGLKILNTLNFSVWSLIVAVLLVMILVTSNIDGVISDENKKNMDVYESRTAVKSFNDVWLMIEIVIIHPIWEDIFLIFIPLSFLSKASRRTKILLLGIGFAIVHPLFWGIFTFSYIAPHIFTGLLHSRIAVDYGWKYSILFHSVFNGLIVVTELV